MSKRLDNPDGSPASPSQPLHDALALTLVLIAVVTLVTVGVASAAILTAAGAFVIGVMTVWFRRR